MQKTALLKTLHIHIQEMFENFRRRFVGGRKAKLIVKIQKSKNFTKNLLKIRWVATCTFNKILG